MFTLNLSNFVFNFFSLSCYSNSFQLVLLQSFLLALRTVPVWCVWLLHERSQIPFPSTHIKNHRLESLVQRLQWCLEMWYVQPRWRPDDTEHGQVIPLCSLQIRCVLCMCAERNQLVRYAYRIIYRVSQIKLLSKSDLIWSAINDV